MQTLPELLLSFNPDKADIDQLTVEFKKIAQAAIYGGYFLINNSYKIYILDVEFYFHSETADGIHEPKMYHQGDVPYFPIGSFHPHNSGVDVTFENELKKFRASFLIRGYKYVDNKETYTNNKSKNYNPTYLREDLFGNASFIGGDGLSITWIDAPIDNYSNKRLTQGPRHNIPIVDGEDKPREWRFGIDKSDLI